ncbi:hypothetical protein MLD38_036271 [Melastoma candidum]|uniref:Uncharacterized protein n=1 Tax=Melastoma candidum TaxID=119954 RepID=A0ACB9LJF7_9MYRT|nr:hypothetical protein MLD38_036271 [Melastoma candidum]
MKVIIEHTEFIKPSSPTPPHLRRHDLCFLDQTGVPLFMPYAVCYEKDDLDLKEKLSLIKGSLSEVLTVFYPLAGRVVGNLYVDCNDQGVPYKEARVQTKLSTILEDPDPNELQNLQPFQLYDLQGLAAAVQVNLFECGGIAIGLCISHKVGDALSSSNFLKAWSAFARGNRSPVDWVTPLFDGASLFPPLREPDPMLEKFVQIVKEGFRSKRFVFDAESLSKLQTKYADAAENKPTRIEALMGFLSGRLMANVRPPSGTFDKEKIIYKGFHAVNLRPRMDPPLSSGYFGNIIDLITLELRPGDEDGKIIRQSREIIKGMDMDFIRKLQNTEAVMKSLMDGLKAPSSEILVPFGFSSLSRLPFYEADFGWGKPAWVGSDHIPVPNYVYFFDGKDGKSIEVYATLKDEDMSDFEKDTEIRAYTAANSP